MRCPQSLKPPHNAPAKRAQAAEAGHLNSKNTSSNGRRFSKNTGGQTARQPIKKTCATQSSKTFSATTTSMFRTQPTSSGTVFSPRKKSCFNAASWHGRAKAAKPPLKSGCAADTSGISNTQATMSKT